MEKGPFTKGHDVFDIIKERCDEGFMGVTYERNDRYTGVWFKTTQTAEAARKTINEHVGWSIMSKPGGYDKEDDDNPFTCDCFCVALVPKDVADRNDKHGGDPMVGALSECVEAGIEVRI